MYKKMIKMLIVATSVAMMFIGCSSDNDTSGANAPKEETVNTVVEKKIFTYAMGADPSSLDPQINTNGDATMINMNLFEGLVVLDDTMQPLPGVAKNWEVSEDGLVYTFNLREDAKWSNGDAITTEDFLYSWGRVLKQEVNSKYAGHLFYMKNAEKIYNGDLDVSELGVVAIDDHTLEVTLEVATPYMFELFARNIYAPVHKATVELNPESWAAHPETCMSNGAFIMDTYDINEKIILKKNEGYWNKDSITMDEAVFVFIGDSGTALTAFEMGEVDGTSSIPSYAVPELILNSDELHVATRLSTRYVTFNGTVEPLDNKKVREALSKAIDRSSIINNITLSGETPATGFVPNGMIVDGKDFRETAGDYGIEVTAMKEEAQAALAEAGYPNGEGWPEGVEMIYSDGDLYKSIAEALQEMWKTNLNIDIELVAVESKVASSRRKSGDYTITIGSWGADYSYPTTFLDLWESNGLNYAQYSNAEYDGYLSSSRATTDDVERLDYLYKAEKLAFGEDFIIAPLHYRTKIVLMKDYVSGWKIDPLGKLSLTNIDINK